MVRFIYNLLWPVGLLLFLPRYLVKMFRRGGYRENFGQRFGSYDRQLCGRFYWKKTVWLHAVSVGEVAIALKLARQIRALNPDLHFALTVTTTTGFAFARQNPVDWIDVLYSPLDFWPIVRRAFACIRPKKIVLVEAEVWPNLVAEAHARRIPVVLINARLSPRSEKRFRAFKRFVAPTFQLLDRVCVQTAEDAARWSALGVDPARIVQLGSVKYDPENATVDPAIPREILAGYGLQNRTVIFGGSTHQGEEKILMEVFRSLRRDFVELLLVLAPRHTERTAEIQQELTAAGFQVTLRSLTPVPDPFLNCIIIDSTGELRDWYGVATVVFIGKSLSAHGGQNPAEAILAGKPVWFGPNMENFATLASALVSHGGAVQVSSPTDLRRSWGYYLANPDEREKMVENARQVLELHRGATARTAELVLSLESDQ